jgi:asparaginyl-tRNA synthetase
MSSVPTRYWIASPDLKILTGQIGHWVYSGVRQMPEVVVHVTELMRRIGQRVLLRGWLADKDTLGHLVFLRLRDGTGTVQAVIDPRQVDGPTWQTVVDLTRESSLEIVGEVRSDERAHGGCEVQVQGVAIIQMAPASFPVAKRMAPEELLTRRHLWLRSRRQQAILRIRAALALALREFLAAEGVVNVDPPLLRAGPPPAERKHFSLDYFGDQAYLAAEASDHLTAAAAALGRVYGFGPVLRADPDPGQDDLTEYWQLEMVAAFSDLAMVLDLAERLLDTACSRVLNAAADLFRADLQQDPGDLARACRRPFPRTTASQTRFTAVVKDDSFQLVAPASHGMILAGGHRTAGDWPGPESATGRRSRPAWQADLRSYGAFPLASFRLEFERLLAWLVGAARAEETIAFPRTLRHLSP